MSFLHILNVLTIQTIQGDFPVAAMVVFKNAKPSKERIQAL